MIVIIEMMRIILVAARAVTMLRKREERRRRRVSSADVVHEDSCIGSLVRSLKILSEIYRGQTFSLFMTSRNNDELQFALK